MPFLHAIVLGAVQGLTEFLPISSSGHLHLTRWLFGWEELTTSSAVSFDVAVHVGTLVGAIGYLWHDVKRYTEAVFLWVIGRQRVRNEDSITGIALAISTVPAAIVGLLLGDLIVRSIQPLTIALALIVFGVLLGWADRYANKAVRVVEDLGFKSALLLGSAQVLALHPGVSRSGITITAARLQGFKREEAVKIAFLMGIPVIAGAGFYKLIELDVSTLLWPAMIWGAATAAVTGWLAAWLTMRVASRMNFKPFVLYRIVVGLGILVGLVIN
ncbi:MAG: undecaprenyl-diphosphate phosphatase [Acidimicrobiaceae bacterium]|nr:undecaprenyl-diphosphate phosphatase [Acidimicrobiaceae bacterium]